MKWAGLAFILFTTLVLTFWLRTNPRGAKWAWVSLTLLPFVLIPLHLIIAPYAIPHWSGAVKGWEISLLDGVAIAIIFGTRGRWPRMVMILPFLAYIGAVTLAVLQARFPMAALATPIQLIRIFLVFLAAAKVAQMEEGEKALLTGLVCGIAIQAVFATLDRAQGVLQTGGSLGHQNLLGFVSHLALMPLFGMFLARRWPMRAIIGVGCALIAVLFTGSRATILLAGLGMVATLLLSIVLRFSGKKIGYAVVGSLLPVAAVPLAYITIERRAADAQSGVMQKDEQRLAFEQAARLMINANPAGVGPNHYVFVSNTEGYADRAKVSWSVSNRAAHVHQSYLLVWAETGYFGIITFVVFLGSAIWYAFSTAIRFRSSSEADVILGIGVGIISMCLHGFVEWMFAVYTIQYVLAGSLGLVVGLRSRLIARSLERRSAPRTPQGALGLRSTPLTMLQSS